MVDILIGHLQVTANHNSAVVLRLTVLSGEKSSLDVHAHSRCRIVEVARVIEDCASLRNSTTRILSQVCTACGEIVACLIVVEPGINFNLGLNPSKDDRNDKE